MGRTKFQTGFTLCNLRYCAFILRSVILTCRSGEHPCSTSLNLPSLANCRQSAYLGSRTREKLAEYTYSGFMLGSCICSAPVNCLCVIECMLVLAIARPAVREARKYRGKTAMDGSFREFLPGWQNTTDPCPKDRYFIELA